MPWQSPLVCLPAPGPVLLTQLHHYLPLAPHTVHTPGLDFKPHLTAGLEEHLKKTGPQIIQPGKPYSLQS